MFCVETEVEEETGVWTTNRNRTQTTTSWTMTDFEYLLQGRGEIVKIPEIAVEAGTTIDPRTIAVKAVLTEVAPRLRLFLQRMSRRTGGRRLGEVGTTLSRSPSLEN